MSPEKKLKRYFNTTGTCVPSMHFIADISNKVEQVMEMISKGDYFTINRPRQYGKTTLIYHLFREMIKNKEYLAVNISFESLGSSCYESTPGFISALLDLICMRLEFMDEDEILSFIRKNLEIFDFRSLSRFFTELTRKTGRKVVLMIDEVDKYSNNQLFLDFLGMLRAKYLGRNEGADHTFHSVILAGVHDIKSLKAKIHPNEEPKYNSPWNIAVDFEVDMSLFPKEIASMLHQYTDEREVKIDTPYFSERLFYFTSGYPFLVSLLCKIIDEKLLPLKQKKEWEPTDLEQAVRIALTKNNTNFETLIKNLENNHELYDLVFDLIMNEKSYSYNLDNPVIYFGKLHGILDEEKQKTKVHNRLYEQRIYNYMASKMETSGKAKFDQVSSSFIEKNGTLNIANIIKRFQDFIKEQGEMGNDRGKR